MPALVFGEVAGGRLRPSVAAAATAAMQCADSFDVVLLQAGLAKPAIEAAHLAGCRAVLVCEDGRFGEAEVEKFCPTLVRLAGEYSHVVGASTSCARALFPRAAALLGVAMASDVVEVIGPGQFLRPVYASNALSVVELCGTPKVLTVRATAFDPAASVRDPAPVRSIEPEAHSPAASEVSVAHRVGTGRPDLSSARVVVSAGRGVKSQDDLGLIEQLADVVGAAVGASRPLVDMGYIGSEHQVGQTGQVVAPELYFAIGVSGAIQHIAGMKDSKVVVAINSDPDAAIFQYATYGLVGDLYELVPKLCESLRETPAQR